MFPALDVGLSVHSLPVTDRQVDDLQIEFGRPENEIEIPERVEISEISPVFFDLQVILPAQDLGPAKGVLDRLTEKH